MKLADLNGFYESLLPDLGFNVEEDTGRILYWHRDSKGVKYLPLCADGKVNVVMPTRENLNSADNNIIFHPLSENNLKGESFIFSTMRKQGNRVIAAQFNLILRGLGQFLVDHAKKPPKGMAKAQRFINMNPEFNDKALRKLGLILDMTGRVDPKKHLIGIYTHGVSEEKDGRKVTRVARVSSALLDTLTFSKGEVYGVKITKYEKAALIDLINSVLPGLNDNVYDHDSDNTIAPYFDCYMQAWLNVEEGLEKIIKVFGADRFYDDLMPQPTYDWLPSMGVLAKLSRVIPPQHGNLGDDVIGRNLHDVNPAAGRTINETAQPTVTTAAAAAAPTQSATGVHRFGGGDVGTSINTAPTAPIRMPPTHQTYGQPASTYGQPASTYGQPANTYSQPTTNTYTHQVSPQPTVGGVRRFGN